MDKMVGLASKHEFVNEDVANAFRNNDAEGGDKQHGKVLESEQALEAQLNEMRAKQGAAAAMGAATGAEQSAANVVIDMVSGQTIDLSSFGSTTLPDEINVAAITDMLNKGVSDQEIEQLLTTMLDSVAANIVSDKVKAKKYLAQLLEVLTVLEISMKNAGQNPELQNSLRQMQEKLSNLIRQNNPAAAAEFLRSQALKETLSNAVKSSRGNVDMLQAAAMALRNVAQEVAAGRQQMDPNALRLLAEALQKATIGLMRETTKSLAELYNKLSEQLKSAQDPALQKSLLEAINKVVEQANKLNAAQLQRQGADVNTQLAALKAVQEVSSQLQNIANNYGMRDLANRFGDIQTRAQNAPALAERDTLASRVDAAMLNGVNRQNIVANFADFQNRGSNNPIPTPQADRGQVIDLTQRGMNNPAAYNPNIVGGANPAINGSNPAITGANPNIIGGANPGVNPSTQPTLTPPPTDYGHNPVTPNPVTPTPVVTPDPVRPTPVEVPTPQPTPVTPTPPVTPPVTPVQPPVTPVTPTPAPTEVKGNPPTNIGGPQSPVCPGCPCSGCGSTAKASLITEAANKGAESAGLKPSGEGLGDANRPVPNAESFSVQNAQNEALAQAMMSRFNS